MNYYKFIKNANTNFPGMHEMSEGGERTKQLTETVIMFDANYKFLNVNKYF